VRGYRSEDNWNCRAKFNSGMTTMDLLRSLWMLMALAPLVRAAETADWPQWRGPDRSGVWKEKSLPDRFPARGLTARWRKPVGGGYAGIAVAGGRVYTMDRQKQPREAERVLCLDAATGETLWTHEYPVRYGKMDYGNGPRSTPTVHDGRVYTFGAVGHLHCLDAVKGKVLWSVDTVRKFQGRIPTWGHACSPLVDGNRLVVQVGGKNNACLVALDRRRGREVWRSLSDRPGYSSPVLIDTKGGRQLVYWTPENVVGLDPALGNLLWKVPFASTYGVAISDPVWHNGVLLVSGYWEGSKAIRLDDKGKRPKVIWQGSRLSLLMSTPLARGGYVYALDKKNGLKCIELATGKVKWEKEHVTPQGRNPQASLAWAGERALIFNAKGELILAKLTPAGYRQLGKAAVIGDTWANPAFAGKCVFARNDKEIVCVPLGK
jgi:outer membrane protein assembly factor BamB